MDVPVQMGDFCLSFGEGDYTLFHHSYASVAKRSSQTKPSAQTRPDG